ncbi:m126 protein [Murid betaherpesvirus 1]|nr:m126 protein [Murid betaherpesvirus 1]
MATAVFDRSRGSHFYSWRASDPHDLCLRPQGTCLDRWATPSGCLYFYIRDRKSQPPVTAVRAIQDGDRYFRSLFLPSILLPKRNPPPGYMP